MTGKQEPEVVQGFVEETREYLPKIREHLTAFRRDPEATRHLEEMHRFVHTIRGAAGMVGYPGLGHIARDLEERLEEIAAGTMDFTAEVESWIRETADTVEEYLEGISAGDFDEREIAEKSIRALRRMKGLPQKGDDEAVRVRLEMLEAPPSATLPDAADDDELSLEDWELEEGDTPSPELVATFMEEARDHMQLVTGVLSELERSPGTRGLFEDLRRSVHSLKGAAAMVGYQTVSQLSHRMEDLLDRIADDRVDLNRDAMDLLWQTSDMLEDMTGREPDPPEDREAIKPLLARYEMALATVADPEAEEPGPEPRPAEPATEQPAASKKTAEPRVHSEVVRIPLERLDELVSLVSELTILRSRFEQYYRHLSQQVDEVNPSLGRLRRVSGRLETQFEAAALGTGRWAAPVAAGAGTAPARAFFGAMAEDFDELEFDRYTEFHMLSRELAETTNDVGTLGLELNDILRDFEGYLLQSKRLSSEIQDKLMKLRMIPLAALSSRLERTVRVTAAQSKKSVNLIVEGKGVELDKKVMDALADPLLHILRNAVDHGIEPPDRRRANAKPATGEIRVQAFYAGTEVVIRIGDDGAGIDLDRVVNRALSLGLLSQKNALLADEEELFGLLFQPGFTTAERLSEVSGRGIGMDVVKDTVEKLKGTIGLSAKKGSGVTITIRLPLTLAVTRVLMVRAHGERFAVPLAGVRKILRLDETASARIGSGPLRIEGVYYPTVVLGEALALKGPADESVAGRPAMILDIGAQHEVVLIVDHLQEAREVVVKNLGSHLRKVPAISGATVMGDGSVVLILNPAELMERKSQPKVKLPSILEQEPAPAEIMIVDDSLSVRKVLGNVIRTAGWHSVEARDGVEALEYLRETANKPDLILLDIEMPRMDGYELTSILKNQESLQEIPIVIITSRAAEKHRRKAMDLGVSEYLVKPFQEARLVSVIENLTGKKKDAKHR